MDEWKLSSQGEIMYERKVKGQEKEKERYYKQEEEPGRAFFSIFYSQPISRFFCRAGGRSDSADR